MSFSYKGKKSDIDALIYNDDFMIVVECKSPTSSTNIFELRSIFSYLTKASKQLDLSVNALNDDFFYETKMLEWGIPCKKRKIYSLICNAQREFNGCKIGNHPVRSVKELCNFIVSGNIIMCAKEYHVRNSNDVFESIINYLGENNFIFDAFDNMSAYNEIFHIGKYKFECQKFAVNLEDVDKTYALKYKMIKSLLQ